MLASYVKSRAAAFLFSILLATALGAHAQSGSSTSITGTVVDPSGAVVTNATVEVRNPVSGFSRNAVTDAAGKFVVPNVPFNPYHVTVTAQGFAPYSGDVDVRSTVPVSLNIALKVGGSEESVTVEANGGDLVETTSTFQPVNFLMRRLTLAKRHDVWVVVGEGRVTVSDRAGVDRSASSIVA